MQFLHRWCWNRKIRVFYRILKENITVYLFNLVPTKHYNYSTRNVDKIVIFHTKHSFLNNSFFSNPLIWIEWGKLGPNVWSATQFSVFKKNLLKSIRPFTVFLITTTEKELNTLCGLSQLREYKFKHGFQDTLNPFYWCGLDIERITHFFLYYLLFSNQRCIHLGTVNDIDSSLRNTNNSILTYVLLFGETSLHILANNLILNATYEFMLYLWIMLHWRTNFKKFFLVFCRFLLYVDLFSSFLNPKALFWDYTFIFI